MARLLLTPAQVTYAVTSGVVVLFTLALFLSGYAIQQRTLRHLRDAIRPNPRPSPKIYLPDRFRDATTELSDGTIILLEEDEDKDSSIDAQIARLTGKKKEELVEIKPTEPQEPAQHDSISEEPATAPQLPEQPKPAQVPFEPWSQRGDAKVTEKSEKVAQPDPESEDQDSVSRAERRRLIKEEIHRLAQGDVPIYYQRRLW